MITIKGLTYANPRTVRLQQRHLPIDRKSHFFWCLPRKPLKAEISEYVVTESIEQQFVKLLERMQLAMESADISEIGVWLSGFYGSGKSSFAKYAGSALDTSITIDGIPFFKHLQDRLHTPQAKALLGTLVQRYPAAVVMLDLAARCSQAQPWRKSPQCFISRSCNGPDIQEILKLPPWSVKSRRMDGMKNSSG